MRKMKDFLKRKACILDDGREPRAERRVGQ